MKRTAALMICAANYHVHKLFANHRGTRVLPMMLENKPLIGQNGLYASAALDRNSDQIILKLVNSTRTSQTTDIVLDGAQKTAPIGRMIVLRSDDPDAINSLEQPAAISPVERELVVKGKTVRQELEPYSLTVITVRTKR